MKKTLALLLCLLLALSLTACGDEPTKTSTDTPSQTASETATVETETATATATAATAPAPSVTKATPSATSPKAPSNPVTKPHGGADENSHSTVSATSKQNIRKNPISNSTNIGDTAYFGAYEQDNNTANGKEDIAWIVLAKENGNALVISQYALDCQPYNTKYTNVTWESCSLRQWLNGAFLNDAFSADEQAKIEATKVTADKNREYSTNPGNATTDKVFLLSTTETEKYFATNEARKCAPTAYAKAQVAYTSTRYETANGEATCFWWLRSPGSFQNYAAIGGDDGSVGYYGDFVDDSFGCVRPALWIHLSE